MPKEYKKPTPKKPYVRKDGTIGKTGRKIDKELFEKLCTTMCTQQEVASVLGVSHETLRQWCIENYDGNGFVEVHRMFNDNLKAQLKGMVFKRCAKSDAVLIFTLKNVLGWSDKVEQETTEKVQFINDMPKVDD